MQRNYRSSCKCISWITVSIPLTYCGLYSTKQPVRVHLVSNVTLKINSLSELLECAVVGCDLPRLVCRGQTGGWSPQRMWVMMMILQNLSGWRVVCGREENIAAVLWLPEALHTCQSNQVCSTPEPLVGVILLYICPSVQTWHILWVPFHYLHHKPSPVAVFQNLLNIIVYSILAYLLHWRKAVHCIDMGMVKGMGMNKARDGK